jgi:hypothetical protein
MESVANKAAMVQVYDEGRRIAFDPQAGFIDFPGGMSKFTIRYDVETGLYLTLSNNVTVADWPGQRNILSLHASKDLRQWRHVQTLLEDGADVASEPSLRLTGFQYVDWQFDGQDIIYLVRAAYGGAHNYHDSNRITFHRLRAFRGLL